MASSRHEWVIDRQVDRFYDPTMPQGLKRFHHTGKLHFVTFSCHHRLPYLLHHHPKQTVETVLEQTRREHGVEIHGYVLMPEHVHLLLSEPTQTDLATTLKVLKQQTSKLLVGDRDQFWQTRYYDFNVRTEAKRLEKLRYIHRNPVKRGLSLTSESYPWSSAHHYATGLPGTIHLHSHGPPETSHTAKPKAGAPFVASFRHSGQRPTGSIAIHSPTMGLDTVELVLRTEETFLIDLPDDECARIFTVGDLYRAVLAKLDLPYLPLAEAEALPHRTHLSRTFHIHPWTTPDVWANIKATIVDQLQIGEDEVRESARFQADLGCE